MPGYSTHAYPFRSLHDGLHRIFDAYGPERFFWGTDITRMHCAYRQCVTIFTGESPWLKGRDLELVMGRAVCDRMARMTDQGRDTVMRLAAFEHIRSLGEVHDHLIAVELKHGFVFEGQRIPLVNTKPRDRSSVHAFVQDLRFFLLLCVIVWTGRSRRRASRATVVAETLSTRTLQVRSAIFIPAGKEGVREGMSKQ